MTSAARLALLLVCAACLSPDRAEPPRYYSPERPARDAAPAAGAGVELRLLHVVGAGHLRARIAWRSGVEYGFYEWRRWTDAPALLVERALEQELFERAGARLSEAHGVASLEVELGEFEDLLESPRRAVVGATARLYGGDRVAVMVKTYRSEVPVPGDEPEALARSMGAALDEVVRGITADVVAALGG